MSRPPPLPDTDDPFELLGVDRDADEDVVKRAYAKLVRAYRPDRSPAEFQRVQQAFESVREWLAWTTAGADPPSLRPPERVLQGPEAGAEVAPFELADEATRECRELEERVARLLVRGEVETLLTELAAPDLLDRAERLYPLRCTAMRVAVAAVLDHPAEADAIHDRLAWDDIDATPYEDRFAALRGSSASWRRWCRHGPSSELRLSLQLLLALERDELAPLGLRDAVRHDPVGSLASMELLSRREPRLFYTFLEYVEMLAGSLDDDEPDEVEREFDVSADRIDALVERTEKEAVEDKKNHLGYGLSFLLLIAAVGSIFLSPMWVSIPLFALTSASFWVAVRDDRRLYREVVRPLVLEVLVEGDTTPARLVAEIRRRSRASRFPSSALGRFDDELESDPALRCLWLMLVLAGGPETARE